MLLFVAGAAFGDWIVTFSGRRSLVMVGLSLFVAGAAFGDVGASLFVPGAAFRGAWRDSRGAKCCIFQYKMHLQSAKSNLGERAGAR